MNTEVRQKVRQYISSILIAMMIVEQALFTSYADVYVAEYNGQKYTSASAAIEAVGDNEGAVTLLCDTAESITIGENQSITLDLGNYTLKAVNGSDTITVKGELTVVGDGAIEQTSSSDTYNTVTVYPEGHLIIEGGSWYCSKGYVIKNLGTTDIYDGTVYNGSSSNYSSLVANGWYASSTYLQGTTDRNQKNDGTYTAVLNVYGGEFTNNASSIGSYLVKCEYYSETNIYGGSFTTDNNVLLSNAASMFGVENSSKIELNISGGTFDTSSGASLITTSRNSSAEVEVSGGWFTSAVDTKYIAQDYELTTDANHDPTYKIVLSASAAVARIDDTYYKTVQAAIDAAGTDEVVVVMLKNSAENIIIQEDQNITLMADDGFTLSSADVEAPTITNYGTLTLAGEIIVVQSYDGTDNVNYPALVNMPSGEVIITDDVVMSKSSKYGYLIKNMGTMTIEGGEFKNENTSCSSALIDNGFYGDTYNDFGIDCDDGGSYGATLTINGGTFIRTGGGSSVLKTDRFGYTVVNDGTFKSNCTCTLQNCGETVINGGSFTDTSYCLFYNSAFTDDALGILTINGGTFDCTSGISYVFLGASDTVNGVITITDGTFLYSDSGVYLYAKYQGATDTIAISGGYFTQEVASSQCATGYEPYTDNNHDPKYTVKTKAVTTDIQISAVDSTDNSVLVEGVGMSLYKTDESPETLIQTVDSTDTAIDITSLLDGEYSLRQTTSLSGYDDASDVNFVITNGVLYDTGGDEWGSNLVSLSMTVTAVVIPTTTTIWVSAVDSDDSDNLIEGVEMELRRLDTQTVQVIATLTSTDEGIEIPDLEDGEYYLTQTSSLEGYELASDVYFNIVDGILYDATTGEELDTDNIVSLSMEAVVDSGSTEPGTSTASPSNASPSNADEKDEDDDSGSSGTSTASPSNASPSNASSSDADEDWEADVDLIDDVTEKDDTNSTRNGHHRESSRNSTSRITTHLYSYASPQSGATVSTGKWRLVNVDKNLWMFDGGGTYARDGWFYIENPYSNTGQYDWFHFDKNGYMSFGWYTDDYVTWYFLHDVNDGDFGRLEHGWHSDPYDGEWYYLDDETGAMYYGRHEVDGDEYYFNTTDDIAERKWYYNEEDRHWDYEHDGDEKGSYGSLAGNR